MRLAYGVTRRAAVGNRNAVNENLNESVFYTKEHDVGQTRSECLTRAIEHSSAFVCRR